MDVKHHVYLLLNETTVQELCESRGGRPRLPVPSSHFCLCGRKAALNLKLEHSTREPVWSSGQALGWEAYDVSSIPRFGSPFS